MMLLSNVGILSLGNLTPVPSAVVKVEVSSTGVGMSDPLILQEMSDSSLSRVECMMDSSSSSPMSLVMSLSYVSEEPYLKIDGKQ